MLTAIRRPIIHHSSEKKKQPMPTVLNTKGALLYVRNNTLTIKAARTLLSTSYSLTKGMRQFENYLPKRQSDIFLLFCFVC